MSDPTIADVKALQRRLDLMDVHVCWIGRKRFVTAHPDGKDRELHDWLADQWDPPAKPGYYIATPHHTDPDSEPHPAARFDFVPLDVPKDKPAQS